MVGQPEHHGHVAVMPACVHHAFVARGERHAGFFRHRQSVHVGANARGVLGASVEECAYGAFAGGENLARPFAVFRDHGIANALQLGGNVRDGFRYVEVDFGNLVKVPTKAGKHFEFVRVGFGCHAGPFRWAEERFLRAV